MRTVLRLIISAGLTIAAAATAQQRHDTNAPISFDAPHAELQDQQGRAILSGGVVIKQAEMTLSAARVTISYSGKALGGGGSKASRIDASGGVVVTRPDQRASGAYGVYDLNRRTIIMLGGVKLTQGANTVNGNRLTINLDTGRAVIDGSGGTSGGRVTGTFSVPKRN